MLKTSLNSPNNRRSEFVHVQVRELPDVTNQIPSLDCMKEIQFETTQVEAFIYGTLFYVHLFCAQFLTIPFVLQAVYSTLVTYFS